MSLTLDKCGDDWDWHALHRDGASTWLVCSPRNSTRDTLITAGEARDLVATIRAAIANHSDTEQV